MKLKFTCKNCGKTGHQLVSMVTPFVHAYWYTDHSGLVHGLLYCRSCGAVHDTIGSFLAPMKLILRRFPSKVIVVYEISAFRKLLRISNPDFIRLVRLPRVVGEAMIEDGRLSEEEEFLDEPPTVDFLLNCLQDEHFIVRREAIIAIRREGHSAETVVIDRLIESLEPSQKVQSRSPLLPVRYQVLLSRWLKVQLSRPLVSKKLLQVLKKCLL